MKPVRLILLLFFVSTLAHADVTLPKIISDGMVLQRDRKVSLWGWAAPGEKITISFNHNTCRATTAADGTWKAELPGMKPGGPYDMTIKGTNEVRVRDILIGDVWFCSGQSNMVLTMERVKEKYPDEIANANYPMIRNFLVPTYSDVTRVHDDLPSGEWVATTPETIYTFGAVAWFFAKAIYEKHRVPIGIINSSVGGTPVEAWVSAQGLKSFPKLDSMIRNYHDSTFIADLMARVNAPRTIPDIEPDRGMEEKWYEPDTNTERWHDFWLPGYWEDQGVNNLHGNLWFRRDIFVPDSLASKQARLFVGRIVDADVTYVNDERVGNITYQYPPRRYPLPDGIIKPGRNTIVVHVTNYSGKGGFVPDKPYYLALGDARIDIRGDWKYQVGNVFPPYEGQAPVRFSAQNEPTGLYNTMVAPVIPYTVKGFNWYQGESNTDHPEGYARVLSALIQDWRSRWGEGVLPFAFVQLANFMEATYLPVESNWAVLRDEQRNVLSVPNTAMAVIIDAGEWNDVHPLNKKVVGDRLAAAMEHLAYGDNTIVYSGPLYQSHTIEGNKISITFSHAGGGLVARGDHGLHYFEIAGADGKYVTAHAEIQGDRVVVWSDAVKNPVSVRYAWADNPGRANLYNREGFPASPFQTR